MAVEGQWPVVWRSARVILSTERSTQSTRVAELKLHHYSIRKWETKKPTCDIRDEMHDKHENQCAWRSVTMVTRRSFKLNAKPWFATSESVNEIGYHDMVFKLTVKVAFRYMHWRVALFFHFTERLKRNLLIFRQSAFLSMRKIFSNILRSIIFSVYVSWSIAFPAR